MTRDEERIEQIENFASQCYEDRERYSAFIAGAIFADNNPPQDIINLNNVWHDASDNPTEDTLILYRTASGECDVTELVCTSEGVWHLFVNDYEVAEWAYISDLLPKGGEK